jgi:hypothetical protein
MKAASLPQGMLADWDCCPGRGRLSATQRLEQLEHPEQESQEATRLLSQQEVVLRLRQLNEDMGQAWVASERLTALRLAIKVATHPAPL